MVAAEFKNTFAIRIFLNFEFRLDRNLKTIDTTENNILQLETFVNLDDIQLINEFRLLFEPFYKCAPKHLKNK